MAGQIHAAIEKIIAQKSKGNAVIASSIRTKMILKGITVNKFDARSPDDPEIMKTLRDIAKDLGVSL